jgi:hypothetical protein
MASSLTNFWPLSGNFTDIVSNISTSPVTNQAFVSDRFGNPSCALSLASLYPNEVVLGSNVKLNSKYSVSFWIYLTTRMSWQGILTLDCTDKLSIYTNQFEGICLRWPSMWYNTKTIPTNEWVFVTIVNGPQPKSQTLYINGVYEFDFIHGPVGDEWVKILVGGGVNIILDDIKVWSENLSSEQIRAEYIAKNPPTASPNQISNGQAQTQTVTAIASLLPGNGFGVVIAILLAILLISITISNWTSIYSKITNQKNPT